MKNNHLERDQKMTPVPHSAGCRVTWKFAIEGNLLSTHILVEGFFIQLKITSRKRDRDNSDIPGEGDEQSSTHGSEDWGHFGVGQKNNQGICELILPKTNFILFIRWYDNFAGKKNLGKKFSFFSSISKLCLQWFFVFYCGNLATFCYSHQFMYSFSSRGWIILTSRHA